MKNIYTKDIQPIEGFKVMEWVRSVREKLYELYITNPEAYRDQLSASAKNMPARFEA